MADEAPDVPPEAATPLRDPGGRRLLAGCVFFALAGAVAMLYFDAFELTSRTKYHRDLTQTPHWVAMISNAFPADDLLLRYGAYNESPLQNAIYWAGTRIFDLVLLHKLVGVVIFGLTAALFFLLATRLSGLRAGILAAAFFVIFPKCAYEIAGGFSKAWAIGFVLLSVYAVEARAWRILPWALPLAALAYPVSAVLFGAVVAVGLVLEFAGDRREALRGLKFLVVGSAVAVGILLSKYLDPQPFIGQMISSARIREMWRTGLSSESTAPLWEDVFGYLEHPFFILGAAALFMLLARRGLVWKRSWTALAIASAAFYLTADFVIPRLYLPDRYTRYSMAALLVLWHAHNWDRALDCVRWRSARWLALAALVVTAALSFPDTFKQCDGDKSLGRWEDRGFLSEVSAAVAAQPLPVLVAGPPIDTACVLIQARRPVLTSNRMFHAWYDKWWETVDARHRATFRAFYARKPEDVNQLVTDHGVTHLLVRKSCFAPSVLRNGDFYREEYNEFIKGLARGSGKFLLNPPPPDTLVYEDELFWLVKLPLPER